MRWSWSTCKFSPTAPQKRSVKGDTDTATSWVRAQYNFLDVHLDSWAPLLTAEVKKFAKTDFYRGLAFLTEGFLETDREVLEELLAED